MKFTVPQGQHKKFKEIRTQRNYEINLFIFPGTSTFQAQNLQVF
jgi:hypothetical protein